jgi:hypothetical protein
MSKMSALTPESVERLESLGIPVDSPSHRRLEWDVHDYLEDIFWCRELGLSTMTDRQIKLTARNFCDDGGVRQQPIDKDYQYYECLEEEDYRHIIKENRSHTSKDDIEYVVIEMMEMRRQQAKQGDMCPAPPSESESDLEADSDSSEGTPSTVRTQQTSLSG